MKRGCLGFCPMKAGATSGAILGQSERQIKLSLCVNTNRCLKDVHKHLMLEIFSYKKNPKPKAITVCSLNNSLLILDILKDNYP